ncbi:MAG: SDR family NAD(P)-dependent oxidoreductase [Nitrososphaeraceae archaeon]
MKKLEGKVAVITGGSSGIGLATAQRFVDEGAYVFITGRRQSELDAAVKQIGKNNNNVTGVQGDVSNRTFAANSCVELNAKLPGRSPPIAGCPSSLL